jgi:hypothetical protein
MDKRGLYANIHAKRKRMEAKVHQLLNNLRKQLKLLRKNND